MSNHFCNIVRTELQCIRFFRDNQIISRKNLIVGILPQPCDAVLCIVSVIHHSSVFPVNNFPVLYIQNCKIGIDDISVPQNQRALIFIWYLSFVKSICNV